MQLAHESTSDRLFEWLASVSGDPLAFVMGAFPWGKGVLEKFSGPEQWAKDLMNEIKAGLIDRNKAIQLARASGHGIGKSCTVAQIILWAFCTAPDTRGVITAETETQLKTKTWAELGKWFNLSFFCRDHFTLTATGLFSKDRDRDQTWRIDMVPWSIKNPDAFAGLHNQGKRLLLIFDEASRIEDPIWEVAEGALTDSDTEIMWLVFGNPTKNSGRFKECFEGGMFHKYWSCKQIDSRTVSITNKERCQYWIEAYGPDSDQARTRVYGQFPERGLMEFFSASEIDAAMAREVIGTRSDPLALGVDVARYGANSSVVFPRKGRDARTIPRERFQGISTVELADRVFDISQRLHADGVMVDGGGVGGGVIDNIRSKRMFCYEVQFGGKDVIWNTVWGNTGERYANNRAAMYGALRAWLKTGALPNDPDLRRQMLAIRYTHKTVAGHDEIILEAKEDLLDEDGYGISVDDVDALCLTFSHALAPHADAGGEYPHKPQVEIWWDPLAPERMVA
jgi:hypothetical protein